MSDAIPLSRKLAAAAVHCLTASGILWALLAMLAATQSDWRQMFLWLAIAFFVDGIDGPLARITKVRETLPGWDGGILDLTVDYLTYVFIPAYAAMTAGLFPEGYGLVGAAIICLSSAGFFMKREQKSADNYFIGFPTTWNLQLLFWFVSGLPPAWVMVWTIFLAIMTFLPVMHLHPIRSKRFVKISIPVLIVFFVGAGYAVYNDFQAPLWLKVVLAGVVIYQFATGYWRTIVGPDPE